MTSETQPIQDPVAEALRLIQPKDGDAFAILKQGTDLKGGGQDLDALIAYLEARERAPVPSPRITRLP